MKYTYFFHNPDSGLTKIGKTSQPAARFKAIRSQEKVKLVSKCLLKGDCELRMHARFVEFRVIGEWFRLDDETLSKIQSMPGNLITDAFTGFPTDGVGKYATVRVSSDILKQVKLSAASCGEDMVTHGDRLIMAGLKAGRETK